MSGIKGRNTKPELLVRSYLHKRGLRFRLHDKTLPGKPDLVFRKRRAVVEVRGCFWHQHPDCRLAYMPSSNSAFWMEKLQRNVERDRRNELALKAGGWRVFVVWECQTKDHSHLSAVAAAISQLCDEPRHP